MLATKSNLIALALAVALASPLAIAKETKASPTTKATPAVPAMPEQHRHPVNASSRSSDAISDRTTKAESRTTTPVMEKTSVERSYSPPGKGNWWADADLNGDGRISATEAKANAGLDSRFGSVDANKDGFVSMDEYRRFYTSNRSQGELHAQAHSAVVTRDIWTRLDANKDGKLGSSEVSTNTTISRAFSSMDGNGDGFVTQAEYTAYAKTHL